MKTRTIWLIQPMEKYTVWYRDEWGSTRIYNQIARNQAELGTKLKRDKIIRIIKIKKESEYVINQ